MTNSMTGFAAAKGATGDWSWGWDIRAVNARGLDVRLRLPDWIEGLEQMLRPIVQKSVVRGNVSLSLRVQSVRAEGAVQINADALARALEMIGNVEATAQGRGVSLTPATAADVLMVRGVLESAVGDTSDTTPLSAALKAALPQLLKAFNEMRQAEGKVLHGVLSQQVDRIETLTSDAAAMAAERLEQMQANLRENLARVLDNAEGSDPDRVAQELALLAVKSDVTEEIDRLGAHVKAARHLLASKDAVGRKLDFLTQEFNREANTLCSKAQSSDLTAIGLDLKAVIDQMREQVQNVE